MLVKYSVITLTAGSHHIKRIIDGHNFINDENYQLRNVSELRHKGGTFNKNEYYFHPRAFKICLMRSIKTSKYANYYLLLEECIKYFNDYQTELNKKYIIKLKSKILKKENKICSLEEKLNIIIKSNKETNIKLEKSNSINEELIKTNKETSNEVKLLLKINKRLDKRSNIMEDKLEEVHEDLKDTNHKLDYTCKKLDIAVEKRVPDTSNKNKLEDLILLKSINRKASYRYYAIRAQTEYANTKAKNMISSDQPKDSRYTEIKKQSFLIKDGQKSFAFLLKRTG